MGFAKYSYFLLVVFCATDVLSDSVITPCKIEDESCIYTSAQAAIPKLLAGFPELGIKASDPLFIERLEGNLTGFTYVFFNATITGLKDCAVSNIKIDSKVTSLHYELNCPSLKQEGEYQMAGTLIAIPVEGSGHFVMITGTYHFSVDSKLKVTSSDGQNHLNIYDNKIKSESRSPVQFAFDNLYNGNKDKADAFHKSAHDNWKRVQDQAEGPLWQAVFDSTMGNFNSYFEKKAFEVL